MGWLYFLIGVGVGVVIGMYIKDVTPGKDKEAIKKATSDLDKGNKELQKTIDKNKL